MAIILAIIHVRFVQAVSEKDRQEMGERLLRAAEDGSLEKALQSKAGLPNNRDGPLKKANT